MNTEITNFSYIEARGMVFLGTLKFDYITGLTFTKVW